MEMAIKMRAPRACALLSNKKTEYGAKFRVAFAVLLLY